MPKSRRICWGCGIARARTARGPGSPRPSRWETSHSSVRFDTSVITKCRSPSTRCPGRGETCTLHSQASLECGGGQPSNDAQTGKTRATLHAERGHAYPALLELRGGVLMLTQRLWVPVAILLVAAGSQGEGGPAGGNLGRNWAGTAEVPPLSPPPDRRPRGPR